jgi:4'-phosphopantetheinyl transferase
VRRAIVGVGVPDDYHHGVPVKEEGVMASPSNARATWELARRDIHVWEDGLDRPFAEVLSLRGLLSDDERARADRFRFERDRSRYTVGRALLRRLLGRYLDLDPASVRFTYGPNDKPLLADGGLWFNLSHSGPVALFAFTREAEVGIDVELENDEFAQERIAERFFSPAEVSALRAIPRDEQGLAFMTCWTRKEAFIKARGDGLSLPLDSFDVTLGYGSPAALVRTAWSRQEPRTWLLRDISDRERGYVAALAIRSGGARIIRRRLPQDFDDQRDIQEEYT